MAKKPKPKKANMIKTRAAKDKARAKRNKSPQHREAILVDKVPGAHRIPLSDLIAQKMMKTGDNT